MQQPNTRPVADPIQSADPEDENLEAKDVGDKEQDHGLGVNHKKSVPLLCFLFTDICAQVDIAID